MRRIAKIDGFFVRRNVQVIEEFQWQQGDGVDRSVPIFRGCVDGRERSDEVLCGVLEEVEAVGSTKGGEELGVGCGRVRQ